MCNGSNFPTFWQALGVMLFIFGRLHMSERARPRRSGTCRVLWVSSSGQKSCGRPRTGYAHSLSVTLQFPFRALGLSTHFLTSLVSFLSLYFSLRRFHNTTFLKIFLPYCSPPLSLISHPFLAHSLKPPGLFKSFHLFSFYFLHFLPASRLHDHPLCCTSAFYFPSLVVILVIV